MRDKSLSISMVQNESIFGVEALLHTLVPSLKKKDKQFTSKPMILPLNKAAII